MQKKIKNNNNLKKINIIQKIKITHHLFVREHGAVMHQCHAVGGVAVAADSRFSDAATVHLHTRVKRTHLTAEERLLHLRNQLRGTDHHPTDSDELVNI